MKLLSLLVTIAPAAGTMIFGERMGLLALLPALLIEAICLFALKKIGQAGNRMALCFAMEGATLLAAAGSLYGTVSAPAELGIAAFILASVMHAAAYLALCEFILRKER